MSSITQQIAAVQVASRIIAGGSLKPKPGSSQAKLLEEHLNDAARTLIASKNDHGTIKV